MLNHVLNGDVRCGVFHEKSLSLYILLLEICNVLDENKTRKQSKGYKILFTVLLGITVEEHLIFRMFLEGLEYHPLKAPFGCASQGTPV